MVNLKGKVAVVTGASRGVGKGIALGLGEAGATVYVTGRTIKNKTDVGKLGGTVFETAEAVTAMGGKGIAIQCDHTDDTQVEEAFKRIAKENKRIDILVNNAWGGYENMSEGRRFTYLKPFWEQPFWRWDAMFDAGVRAVYTSSAFAARTMTKKKGGLIVIISFWSAQVYLGNTQYGVSKAAVDKMSEYMAHELKKFNVAIVALYPGLVRTESVMKDAKRWEVSGTEARVETQVVLRLSRPEILEELRRSSKAAKYLGEVLSPTAVIVKSGAIQNVLDALTELGLLSEVVKD